LNYSTLRDVSMLISALSAAAYGLETQCVVTTVKYTSPVAG